jgi:hypothetical protein
MRLSYLLACVGFACVAACTQTGVELEIPTTISGVASIDKIELFVANKTADVSTFPKFSPMGPTYERVPGNDAYDLADYPSAGEFFNLMLSSNQIATVGKDVVILVVASKSGQRVAFGSVDVAPSRNRVAVYRVEMFVVNSDFRSSGDRGKECIVWPKGLMLDPGANCSPEVCEPGSQGDECLAHSERFAETVCEYNSMSTCDAPTPGYVCELNPVDIVCFAPHHCDIVPAGNHYETDAMAADLVQESMRNLPADIECVVPLNRQGAPCRTIGNKVELAFPVSDKFCRDPDRPMPVMPLMGRDSFAGWHVAGSVNRSTGPCDLRFTLESDLPEEKLPSTPSVVVVGAKLLNLNQGVTQAATMSIGNGQLGPCQGGNEPVRCTINPTGNHKLDGIPEACIKLN